ncbi:MAG: hypothetical protein ABIQ95_06950 [Bdellovibrionia bacterium]
MTSKNKFSILAILLTLATTQTGCIVGFLFPPLWLVSGGVLIVGAIEGDGDLLTLGWVLDTKNPGRADALNEIPMSEEYAKTALVKIKDIKSYNRDLEKIRGVGIDLANDIRSQMQRQDLRQITRIEQLSHDAQIDRLASKYGFESGEALFNSFSQKELPGKTIAAFAKNMDITEGQAKLLLFYGFGVKSEAVQ